MRAPLSQPALVHGLDSWYLQPRVLDRGLCGFDKGLFHEAFAFLRTERFDARFDRECGLHGSLVLHENTAHPRPYRIEYGICHESDEVQLPPQGSEGERCSTLVSYTATGIPAELWSKRHTPPIVFLLVAHVCTVLRPHVPALQQPDPFPNSFTVHWYPSSRTPSNARGDTRVGFHTDSVSKHGQRVQQRPGTPVISISFGETMWFWAQEGNEAEWAVTPLEHGSVWMWTSRDDKCGTKHAVRYSYEEGGGESDSTEGAVGTGRWVIVARWLDTLRRYDRHFPYRNRSGRECMWL